MTTPEAEATRRGWLPGRLAVLAGKTGMAVLVVVAAGLIALIVVAVRGAPPPANLAQEAHQIATTLRCPICEDLSVADSPAPLAAQMRQQIAQQLKAGRTADQITQGFVASYGDTVLLSPPHQGIAEIAYVLPIAVVAIGVGAGAVLLWRGGDGRRKPAGASARGRPAARLPVVTVADRDRLDDALARLREEEP
ncbi:MAG TPA: cytochrome c-type biogenesis protein CcmH [Pseudonocardiaceae bacterium]|jgi:cytochrome c-type biogenesis protein CcmH|nr:cytochrome c-type biogenesis protein CcmH [Pseudonocardiaceae bacterium]